MIARFATAVGLGVVVTLGLLYTMQRMIDSGREVITAPATLRIVDFVRVERSPVVETRERKPERPPEPEARPEVPLPELDGSFASALPVTVTAPDIATGVSVGHGLGAVSDGEYLPIVKVAPVYPMRALSKHLEGFVLLEFTVTAAGAVKDVVVVESTAQLFEGPAIEAALKFRYKPRIIDGAPVEVVGVRNKILFTMDPGEQLAMQ